MRDPTTYVPPPPGEAPMVDFDGWGETDDGLPITDFWASRPELAHLRVFARSRRAAPWAVLGAALTRVVTAVEPFVVLPPLIGGDASLNVFLGLVGPSGSGKGAAESAARDAVKFDRDLVEAGVGSGEGLAHVFLRHVPGKGKSDKGTTEQHTTRALLRAAEVDTLGALRGRQGSTLMPKLRDAWLGDSLGFAYADVTRRLDLRAHTYRMCLIVGIQPARAAVLLGDVDAGTPQRFLWLPTRDPNVPDTPPATPERWAWTHPNLGRLDPWASRFRIPVCDAAVEAIDGAAVARHQGDVDALDGHALMCRLKTAAALGLLNGHAEVCYDDWDLSGVVMAVSDSTRAAVAASLAASSRQANVAAGRAEGERAVVADEVRVEAAAKRVGRVLIGKLDTDWTASSALRKRLTSRDRGHFDAAISGLVRDGFLEVRDVEYQGQRGVEYRLVTRSPL